MGARSAAASVVRHVAGVAAEATLVAALVATAALALSPVYAPAKFLAGTERAEAAAGVNSITLVTSAGSTTRTAVTYGSSVTTYATLAKDYYLVYVRVHCTATTVTDTALAVGSTVYDAWKNIKTWTWTTGGYATFDLATSSVWTGGGASCGADLLNATYKGGHQVYQTLASVAFAVSG